MRRGFNPNVESYKLQVTGCLKNNPTDFKYLYLWITCEWKSCEHTSGDTRIKCLYQEFQDTKYKLQGVSKRPIRFKVLVQACI